MALTTVTKSPEVVTVSGTTEHTLNIDAILKGANAPINGTLCIQWLSGTSVQFDAFGGAIGATSGALTEAISKLLLPATKGQLVTFKGGAGSETFQVSVV